jgi:hypothetical protein
VLHLETVAETWSFANSGKLCSTALSLEKLKFNFGSSSVLDFIGV